jgi:hypothetical protein
MIFSALTLRFSASLRWSFNLNHCAPHYLVGTLHQFATRARLLRSGDGEIVILRGATFFASHVINSLDSPEFFAVNLWGFDLLSHKTSRGNCFRKAQAPDLGGGVSQGRDAGRICRGAG